MVTMGSRSFNKLRDENICDSAEWTAIRQVNGHDALSRNWTVVCALCYLALCSLSDLHHIFNVVAGLPLKTLAFPSNHPSYIDVPSNPICYATQNDVAGIPLVSRSYQRQVNF